MRKKPMTSRTVRLLAVSVLAVAATAGWLYARRATTTASQKPIRHQTAHLDGVNAPATLGDLLESSELVIRGDVIDSQPFDQHLSANATLIATKYGIRVRDVYKASRGILPSSVVDVYKVGGERDMVDHVLIADDDRSHQFMPGDEYVLFLKWSQKLGMFYMSCPCDEYKVVGGRLDSKDRTDVAKSQHGKSVDAFIEDLKRGLK